MDQLLQGALAPEASGAFFAPARTQSTCSGGVLTDTSSTTLEEAEEAQTNARRITLCKQVLMEATSAYSGTHLVEMPLLKRAACRNSGALLPLLSMLAAEQEPGRMVRALDTLSFLLLDRANRRACHELRALDVLLDILRRGAGAGEQAVALSVLEALCCLCKHDAKDKMALWQHPNRGALLSVLTSRHSSTLVIETLRVCRTLCFAALSAPGSGGSGAAGRQGGACASACCSGPVGGGRAGGEQEPHSRDPHAHAHAPLQLLEPALLTVAAELLHPAADVAVLLKALKLLGAASAHVDCATSSSSSRGPGSGSGSGAGCCGCWHNAVFRIVPLLTHCGDAEVVEAALAVLVNLSQHALFHNMCFASGCIPPLLHLLSHKRCPVAQAASCVLSALAEGGLSRDKLCQDTALLAMLRVLQTNHCVVVTLGVLYMLGRLASYRAQVVRSLRNWGAVALLQRLQAATRDEDAAEGCRQLLQLLGVQQAQVAASAAHAAAAGSGARAGAAAQAVGCGAVAPKVSLHSAYSIAVFGGGAEANEGGQPAAAAAAALCRTISAAAGAVACLERVGGREVESGSPHSSSPASSVSSRGLAERPADAGGPAARPPLQGQGQGDYLLYPGGAAPGACGPMGPIAASVAQAAAY